MGNWPGWVSIPILILIPILIPILIEANARITAGALGRALDIKRLQSYAQLHFAHVAECLSHLHKN